MDSFFLILCRGLVYHAIFSAFTLDAYPVQSAAETSCAAHRQRVEWACSTRECLRGGSQLPPQLGCETDNGSTFSVSASKCPQLVAHTSPYLDQASILPQMGTACTAGSCGALLCSNSCTPHQPQTRATPNSLHERLTGDPPARRSILVSLVAVTAKVQITLACYMTSYQLLYCSVSY